MNRSEFERLRDLHGKRIDADIRFSADDVMKHSLTFRDVMVLNDDGWPVRLYGSYRHQTKTVVFTVVLDGTGPICRICVRGQVHKDCGRTHKHSLLTEECPRQNLAIDVVARPDLDNLTAEEVFRNFCAAAKIQFKGQFLAPEGT